MHLRHCYYMRHMEPNVQLELDPILESQVYLLPKYNSQVNKRNLSQMDAFRSKY